MGCANVGNDPFASMQDLGNSLPKSASILSLPIELITYINSFLDVNDSLRLMLTCKGMYKQERFISAFKGNEEEAISRFFEHAIVNNRPINHPFFPQLYPSLQRLEWQEQPLTEAQLKELLSKIAHVSEVHIENCELGYGHVKALSELKGLKTLSLINCNLDNHAVKLLSNCSSLQHYDLSRNKEIPTSQQLK